MNPFHPASLVDPSLHSKEMLELLELKIDRSLVEHLARVVIDVVDYAYAAGPSLSTRGRSESRCKKHAAFTDFVSKVLSRSITTIPVVLVVLVYLQRSKPYLTIGTDDWACERVFLGALMLASKYTNDVTLKNFHWSLVTEFGKGDVGRVEREFLDVLDWDLSVTESEIIGHHHSLMAFSPRRHRMGIRHRASPPITPPLSPCNKKHSPSWSDSDSDSDESSSPSPRTPPPAYVIPTVAKEPDTEHHDKRTKHMPKRSLRILHIPHFFT